MRTFQRITSHSEYTLWRLHEDVTAPQVYSGYKHGNKESGVKTPPHKTLESQALFL